MGKYITTLRVDTWNISYDYYTVRDCSVAGCDSICRCSRIENLVIESVDSPPEIIVKQEPLPGKKGRPKLVKIDKILEYCFDRVLILNGAFDKDNYEVYISNGYYGEEISSVHFENEHKVLDDVNKLLNMNSDIDRIKFVLEKEYDFVTDNVLKYNNVKIETVELDTILQTVYKKGIIRKIPESYVVEVDKSFPQGVLREIGKEHDLIDGHHRLLECLKKFGKNAKVRYIVLY